EVEPHVARGDRVDAVGGDVVGVVADGDRGRPRRSVGRGLDVEVAGVVRRRFAAGAGVLDHEAGDALARAQVDLQPLARRRRTELVGVATGHAAVDRLGRGLVGVARGRAGGGPVQGEIGRRRGAAEAERDHTRRAGGPLRLLQTQDRSHGDSQGREGCRARSANASTLRRQCPLVQKKRKNPKTRALRSV
ncbi:hypothetical protein CATMIT_01583, partial [Catenibacterium mitsuokai DSM 15897]